jgi:hypothetical protein
MMAESDDRDRGQEEKEGGDEVPVIPLQPLLQISDGIERGPQE